MLFRDLIQMQIISCRQIVNETEYCNMLKNVEQRITPEVLSEDCRMSKVFLLTLTYLLHGADSFLRN
jgi:hypothetical protein